MSLRRVEVCVAGAEIVGSVTAPAEFFYGAGFEAWRDSAMARAMQRAIEVCPEGHSWSTMIEVRVAKWR